MYAGAESLRGREMPLAQRNVKTAQQAISMTLESFSDVRSIFCALGADGFYLGRVHMSPSILACITPSLEAKQSYIKLIILQAMRNLLQ
jgi:hypothetical protein